MRENLGDVPSGSLVYDVHVFLVLFKDVLAFHTVVSPVEAQSKGEDMVVSPRSPFIVEEKPQLCRIAHT